MPFFPCLASGRCRAGRSRVLRLLPMGRNLRVEPFCFARKKVSPMDAYSLLSFLGRTADGLGEQGTEPLPTAAAVGRRSAHSLRYLCSTSIARITDQLALTDGLRLAGSRQRFRPGEAKLHGAISESADEPQTLLRDSSIADGHTVLCPYHWKETGRNHSPRPADVGKALLTSAVCRLRFRPRSSSHCRPVGRISARAALPMVDDSACDGNPLTADRGSAGGMTISSFRLPFPVFQWLLRKGMRFSCQPLLSVLGMIFRCKGMKPPSDGLGIHCQQAEIFLLATAKSVFQAVGNVTFRLPCDGRQPFAGIVKSNPGRQGAKAPNQREKIKIQNKMTHCDTYQIPAYSLSYLINSDPTGLSDLEIELIDGFLAANFPRGFTVDIDTCIDPYFSSVPAFGLPCEVYDLVMYSN